MEKYFRQTGKEPLLYDLLEILVQKLNSERVDPNSAISIHVSETILVLITKLRENKSTASDIVEGSILMKKKKNVMNLISNFE